MGYRPLVGWYGTERQDVTARLNAILERISSSTSDNIAIFYGLGNHGGGPSRRHLADIAEWSTNHPEVDVVFSGLTKLFNTLYQEAAEKGDGIYPSHTGDMHHFSRGCYASVARLKFAYRRLESQVARVERSAAILDAATSPDSRAVKSPAIGEAWDAVLFNTFHDILPGSSIERAFDQQMEWIGGAAHMLRRKELQTINKLADLADTSVRPAIGDAATCVPMLVWNPHPFACRIPVEFECSIDYRPVYKYQNKTDEAPIELIAPDGAPAIYQRIHAEALFMDDVPWRVRVVLHLDLPPMGWSVYELGLREGAVAPKLIGTPATAPEAGVISNGILTVSAKVGDSGIKVERNGSPLIHGDGLSIVTVEDHGGSWGFSDDPEPNYTILNELRHNWQITQVATLERGPVRSSLWLKMTGGPSTLDLILTLTEGRDAVDVSARLLFDERAARVNLVFPMKSATDAVIDMPGGATTHGDEGDVPGGRWLKIQSPEDSFGFASDALSCFSLKENVLRATIARASRYSVHLPAGPEVDPWTPAVDRGELKFNFILGGADEIETKAALLNEPVTVQTVLAKPGTMGRTRSLGKVEPPSVNLLALKPAEDGSGSLVVRLQNPTPSRQDATLSIGNISVALGTIAPGRIETWRIENAGTEWSAQPTTCLA